MNKNKFSPSGVIKQSWKLLKENFSLILGITLIMILISVFFSYFFNVHQIIDITYYLMFAISMIVSVLVSLGFYRILLDLVDGKKTEIREGVRSITFRKFLNALAVSFLYGMICLVGLVLFIIPGIVFIVRFQFCVVAVIDRDSSVIDSLKYSWKITKNNFWRFILLGLISFGLILAGLIALLLGVFIAIMIIDIAYVISYRILTKNLEEIEN
ncbi:MAG: hypothetical protein QMB51_02405 [Patescibacteria group bacterium]